MQVLALALTVLVHFIGAGVLVWALLDGARSSWRDIWPRDDDGRGGDPPVPIPPPSFPGGYGVRPIRERREAGRDLASRP
jgi:hypothetical protein